MKLNSGKGRLKKESLGGRALDGKRPGRDRMARGGLKAALALALSAILLLVVGVIGNVRIAGIVRASKEEAARQSENQLEKQRVMESIRDETAVHEIALSIGEERLVKQLKEEFDRNDLEGAARLLNDNADSFQSLFFGKLADQLCLFDGTVMKDEVEGQGLVFQRAGTVFYGSFKDGKPSGQCAALQAVSLEEGDRYDYSMGHFTEGKMDGAGECGYDYYQGVEGDGDGVVKTVKKGDFSKDLMEGPITYQNFDADGSETTWSMTVKDGVLVPDKRWVPDTAKDGAQIYKLASDTDHARSYVVDGDDMGKELWKNMIPWE